MQQPSPETLTRNYLETTYRTFGKKKFIHPDPIEFVCQCEVEYREIVGLLAACLAYGRVGQILKSIQGALDTMGGVQAINDLPLSALRRRFHTFKHRFTTGDEVAGLLYGAASITRTHGSIGDFVEGRMEASHTTILQSMTALTQALVEASSGLCRGLVSDPAKGSACKRLNLYFRWMVRKDAVDPGGWPVKPDKLIVPLDTHMHRFALQYGLTKRRAADMRTAIEVTDGFRKFSPKDPVKYDFALTRMGILKTAGIEVVLPELK